jgi:hypothetical protein
VIQRCALAVITKRGHSIVPPSISALERDEEDFLHRHVERLRSAVKATDARGRLRPGSTLAADMANALTASDDDFLAFADRLVDELAKAMKSVGNAPDCVVAVLTEGPGSANTTSLLKLDAEIEAAQLEQTRQGIRLRVFQDLLPRPGDLQKGISWPDPRSPESEVIVLDHVKAGTAALYFQSAMRIDASPRAIDTERALLDAISELPEAQVAAAVAAASDGGTAERVVERIRQTVPSFQPTAAELGAGGALAGPIRPGFSTTAMRTFSADGIELKIRLDRLTRVRTHLVGSEYRTTIVTSTPLTPVETERSVGPDE